LLQLGSSELNEPIYGGAVIFGIATLALYYLGYVRKEMNAGLILRIAPLFLLILTILSLAWPWRPWPY
jgi:hypothetical protein